MKELDRTPISKVLKSQFENSESKDETNYWIPFSEIIMECLEFRNENDISQKELAEKMETRQSVISRFENMGRKPNYDFISRLSIAIGHRLGITLFGEYMAVVPLHLQELIKELSEKEKSDIRDYTQTLLEKAISIAKYKDKCITEELLVMDTVQSNYRLLDSLDYGLISEDLNRKQDLNPVNTYPKGFAQNRPITDGIVEVSEKIASGA